MKETEKEFWDAMSERDREIFAQQAEVYRLCGIPEGTKVEDYDGEGELPKTGVVLDLTQHEEFCVLYKDGVEVAQFISSCRGSAWLFDAVVWATGKYYKASHLEKLVNLHEVKTVDTNDKEVGAWFFSN
jgi:hypothetical protein